jgi:hypothetical protein
METQVYRGAAHHLVQVAADIAFINADDFAQEPRGIVFHGGGILWSVLMSFNKTF